MTGPAPGLAYAGFGIRLVAYLIDAAILFAVIFALAAATGGLFKTDPDTGLTTINGAAQGLALVISIGYLVGFWGARSQTPGMMALGLRIVRAQTGAPLDFGVAAIRYVGYIISSLPFGIGLIWAAFDPRKQGWHDKIAGTLVVRPVAP
ncbi:MAG: RDD family protein [Chloroflexi bacterium]|nr:MAG: RDD family protein [Chloroflexota bacterium]